MHKISYPPQDFLPPLNRAHLLCHNGIERISFFIELKHQADIDILTIFVNNLCKNGLNAQKTNCVLLLSDTEFIPIIENFFDEYNKNIQKLGLNITILASENGYNFNDLLNNDTGLNIKNYPWIVLFENFTLEILHEFFHHPHIRAHVFTLALDDVAYQNIPHFILLCKAVLKNLSIDERSMPYNIFIEAVKTTLMGQKKIISLRSNILPPLYEQSEKLRNIYNYLDKNMRSVNKNAPLVSVLMPSYNRAHCIDAAIESILAQDFKNFEFIILDDGSQDETVDILNTYSKKDGRISILRHEKNEGIVKSRNDLLNAASGEFIAWQDSDDKSHPQRLSLLVGFLLAHPEYGGVASGYMMLSEKADAHDNNILLSHFSPDSYRISPSLLPMSLVFRQSLIKDAGPVMAPMNKYSEDLAYILQLAHVGDLTAVPHITYYVNDHDGRMSHNLSLIPGYLGIMSLLLHWACRRAHKQVKKYTDQWTIADMYHFITPFTDDKNLADIVKSDEEFRLLKGRLKIMPKLMDDVKNNPKLLENFIHDNDKNIKQGALYHPKNEKFLHQDTADKKGNIFAAPLPLSDIMKALHQGDKRGANHLFNQWRDDNAASNISIDYYKIALMVKFFSDQFDEAHKLKNDILLSYRRHVMNDAQLSFICGYLFYMQANSEQAITHLQRALDLGYNDPQLFTALAYSYNFLNERARADDIFERAFLQHKNNAEINWFYARYILEVGNYKQGLPLHGSVLMDMLPSLASYLPQWQGDDLKGKRLLIMGHMGQGDMMLASRYLPLMKDSNIFKMAKSITIQLPKSMIKLYKTSFASLPIKFITNNETLVVHDDGTGDQRAREYDYFSTLLYLHHVFATSPENVPGQMPIFKVEASDVIRWNKLLQQKTPHKNIKNCYKIGLVWQGRGGGYFDAMNLRRSIPTSFMQTLYTHPDIQYYLIQKDIDRGDIKSMETSLGAISLGDDLTDFYETAALFKNLDLIISVDTSSLHLAGGLNLPTWMLNRYDSEWIWLPHDRQNIWYPSVDIIRQEHRLQWQHVIDKVNQRLQQKMQEY